MLPPGVDQKSDKIFPFEIRLDDRVAALVDSIIALDEERQVVSIGSAFGRASRLSDEVEMRRKLFSLGAPAARAT